MDLANGAFFFFFFCEYKRSFKRYINGLNHLEHLDMSKEASVSLTARKQAHVKLAGERMIAVLIITVRVGQIVIVC